MTVTVAAATYDLISDCMMGDPIAYGRAKKFGLKSRGLSADGVKEAHPTITVDVSANIVALNEGNVLNAAFYIVVAVDVGTVVSFLIGKILTMPAYIGVMIVGAIIYNIQEARGIKIPMSEMNTLDNVCLPLLLALATCNLKS